MRIGAARRVHARPRLGGRARGRGACPRGVGGRGPRCRGVDRTLSPRGRREGGGGGRRRPHGVAHATPIAPLACAARCRSARADSMRRAGTVLLPPQRHCRSPPLSSAEIARQSNPEGAAMPPVGRAAISSGRRSAGSSASSTVAAGHELLDGRHEQLHARSQRACNTTALESPRPRRAGHGDAPSAQRALRRARAPSRACSTDITVRAGGGVGESLCLPWLANDHLAQGDAIPPHTSSAHTLCVGTERSDGANSNVAATAAATSPTSIDLTTAVSGRRLAGALVLGPGVSSWQTRRLNSLNSLNSLRHITRGLN